uniref:Serine/threonine-protein phosphatase PGAM5, mitochondrial n=1 Tax=Globisporangium ultimum (strain ATCC 200006 / CBS 805.95 / DAOM BR144) TaxID=431595 RepID=K3WKD9_GLOUD
MAPLSGDDRRGPQFRKRLRNARTRDRPHVHFSEHVDEHTPQEGDTYYPTPTPARPVIPTSSTRRYTIDEVELYFSEDTSARPVSEHDYAVSRIKGHDEFLLCGCVEFRKPHMGITTWRPCWAELYHGVVILRKFKDKVVDRKRKLIPITKCDITFLDIHDHLLEIKHLYQGQQKRRILRFSTKRDLFLWWWGIQLASMSPVDSKVLHKSMARPALSPLFFLATAEPMENVFFPRALRRERSPANCKSNGSDDSSTTANTPDRSQGVTHLIFIRHGETENILFRISDREKKLTERGHDQAEQTARFLNQQLLAERGNEYNVTLIYGGLRRTVETASRIATALPWVKKKYVCSFLEEGAPTTVDTEFRQEYRDTMHQMAFEYICRSDDNGRGTSSSSRKKHRLHPVRPLEKFKIIVCHASFIQFCIAQCYGVSKDIIQLGAPIAHCSLTQIDVMQGDAMEAEFTNRVAHLPLTHRTSD